MTDLETLIAQSDRADDDPLIKALRAERAAANLARRELGAARRVIKAQRAQITAIRQETKARAELDRIHSAAIGADTTDTTTEETR